MLARYLISLLAPPLCAVCGGACPPSQPACIRCRRALALSRPHRFAVAGTDLALAAATYEGVVRSLVGGLKFHGRLGLAGVAAEAILRVLPQAAPEPAVVPVPPAPSRTRRRGYDPAGEIARQLAAAGDMPLRPCLVRDDGPRQVGRQRSERLADPPRVRLCAPPPAAAILVDDVVTTGATLSACAGALRGGGTAWVAAAAFARSCPESSFSSSARDRRRRRRPASSRHPRA